MAKTKYSKSEDLYIIHKMIDDGGWFSQIEACGDEYDRKRFYRLMDCAEKAGFSVGRTGNTRNSTYKYRITV